MDKKIVFLPTIIFFIVGTFYIIDQTLIIFALECVSNDPNDKDGDGIPNNIEKREWISMQMEI